MSDPIVKIKHGQLRGVTATSFNGSNFYSFKGIPYAEPPIGKLRFKDPVPIKPWTGIRDATKEGNVSAQIEVLIQKYFGSEDCLYLNVHTPQLPTNATGLLPVLVNIHGGGFVAGSGSNDRCGPEYLMDGGVVLVNFNYRLGVIGYLCTDAVNAHGDMGLKDQNLVLKWVQENISEFNGDPNNVTLMGISAGSASVEYHMLSPYSKGLFHKAILQSGSCLNPWARTRNGLKNAKRLATTLGYKEDSTETVFDYLNKFDAEKLIKTSFTLMNDESTKECQIFPFTPVINELPDYDGFIKGEPLDLLKAGSFHKIPTITGFTEKEGYIILAYYSGRPLELLREQQFFQALPSIFNSQLENCEEKLKMAYNEKNEDNTVNFASDIGFNSGIWISLHYRLLNNSNSDYLYNFTHDGNINFVKIMINGDKPGAYHGDDTTYLFTCAYVDHSKATADDILVKNRMVKLWTDFAKTGNPTPALSDVIDKEWKPTSISNYNYLVIDKDLKTSENLWPERRQLWFQLQN